MGSGNQEYRWIVLIQKAPKGPFTALEVNALMEKGVLRYNDLGVRILKGDEKSNTGWKFLWQYPEFERRLPEEPKPKPKLKPRAKAVKLPPDATVADLVYRPMETTVLRRATAAGHPTVDGLGMLLHQGALAFEMWTGQPAPLEVMRTALLEAL